MEQKDYNKKYYLGSLKLLKDKCEVTISEWNGKQSGIMEERAEESKEIIKKIIEIENLINELDDLMGFVN